MNLNCDAVLDMITLYWDNTLSVSTREAVREHLRVCSACRKQYQQYARTAKLTVRRPEASDINIGSGYDDLSHRLKKQHSLRIGFLAGCACVTLAAVAVSILREKRESHKKLT